WARYPHDLSAPGHAWAGRAGKNLSGRQMPEVLRDAPAVIHHDVAGGSDALDSQERAVAEAMLAVLRLAARRDANAVADGQGELRRPINIESVRKFCRRLRSVAHDQSRSFLVAGRVLVKLKQVARLVLGGVRLLGVSQVGRDPCLDNAFLAEPALLL